LTDAQKEAKARWRKAHDAKAHVKAAVKVKATTKLLGKLGSGSAARSSFQKVFCPTKVRGTIDPVSRPLVVGSDCSGLSTELLALQYAGIPFMSAFASEAARRSA